MKNCVRCGALIYNSSKNEKFCPNHGIILENQDWLSQEEKKETEKGEEKDDN